MVLLNAAVFQGTFSSASTGAGKKPELLGTTRSTLDGAGERFADMGYMSGSGHRTSKSISVVGDSGDAVMSRCWCGIAQVC